MKTLKNLTLPFRILLAVITAYVLSWLMPRRGLYLDPQAGDDNTLNHYVNKWDDDIKMVFQQKTSRLEQTVTADYSVIGYAKSFDTLGQADMQPVETRNEDIRPLNLAAGRRWIDLSDFDWPDYIDSFDKLKVLEDPTNKYVQAGTAAANRRKDKTIIDAALGSARNTTGFGANIVTTMVALPDTQTILHGGTNISIAKLRAAKEILDTVEAGTEEGEERTFVYTANQLNVLLDDNKLTSHDWNNVKALVDGSVDYYLGFNWKRVQSLPKDAGGVRTNLIYVKSAVGLAVGEDVSTDVSQRKDKRGMPWQVYIKMSLGAVRGQDIGVVAIQCQE
ncbi:MAG TPA: phage capsid protein [Geobacteraceae bacterium]